MKNLYTKILLTAIFVLNGVALPAKAEQAEGYYTNSVPAESEILAHYSVDEQIAHMQHQALQPIEGIWEYKNEQMTVAVERFSSPRFSKHISYRIVMLESEDMELLPGTIVGYIAESADNSKFELWLYSEQDGQKLSSPQHCVATLNGQKLTFKQMRAMKVKVRVSLSRFLPSLFKGIYLTPEMKEEPLPVGFSKRFPIEGVDNYMTDKVRYL